MVMDMNQVANKISCLKAIILKAWRERWTDLDWGINIKTVLPRGVSGDLYNLAECILQQAVTGPSVNMLLLGYLKHSLSSQLVSYAVVLKQISRFDDFQKPHCVFHFLKFFESIQKGITCRSKPEETLMPTSMILLVNWLLKSYNYFMFQATNENYITLTPEDIAKEAAKNLKYVFDCDFLSAMFHLGRFLEKDIFVEILNTIDDIENSLKIYESQTFDMQNILKKLKACIEIKYCEPNEDKPLSAKSVNDCLQVIITNVVAHKNIISTDSLINEIILIKRLKNYNFVDLNYEILRCALLSLNKACDTVYEKIWGAFTFVFVPKLMKRLFKISQFMNNYSHDRRDYDKKEPTLHELCNVPYDDDGLPISNDGYSDDVVKAIECILKHSELLNHLDVKCACNCLEYLLNELEKVHLLNDSYVKHFMKLRQSNPILKLNLNPNQNPGIKKFIVTANQSLTGILKILNSEHGKIHDSLSEMLSQVLATKSLDLILAVARFDGKLKILVHRLIKFNENALKQLDLNSSKAVPFDVSFLILCSIVQSFGPEVILEENSDSFFQKWIQINMINNNSCTSSDDLLKKCDQSKVDSLIHCLQSNNTNELDTVMQMKLHQVLLNIPGVLKNILLAWEQGSLSENDVKNFINSLKSFKLCSIIIASASWLCAFLNCTDSHLSQKACYMFEQLRTKFESENCSTDSTDYFNNRFDLSIESIGNMFNQVPKKFVFTDTFIDLSADFQHMEPINKLITDFWDRIFENGFVDNQVAIDFKDLIESSGTSWFVIRIVKELFKYKSQQELEKAVDLAFGLFCYRIELCTILLINNVLPMYTFNNTLQENLNEPHAIALSKLTVYCVYLASEVNFLKSNRKNSDSLTTKKRSFDDFETAADYQMPVTKMMKLNDNTSLKLSTEMESSCSNSNTNSENRILSTLKRFFDKSQCLIIENQITISQQTNFLITFLKMIVKHASSCKNYVSKNISNVFIPTLLKSMPDLFSYDFLLDLYDKKTLYGISNASRDICLLRSYKLKNALNFDNFSTV